MTISDENNSLERRSTVILLPAPLTFCVKINGLPAGNQPENTVFVCCFKLNFYVFVEDTRVDIKCMLFLKCSAPLKQYRRAVESSPWRVEASAEASARDCSRQTARPVLVLPTVHIMMYKLSKGMAPNYT